MPIPTIPYHYHFQLFYYFKLQTSYPFTFLILNSESQYYFENLDVYTNQIFSLQLISCSKIFNKDFKRFKL